MAIALSVIKCDNAIAIHLAAQQKIALYAERLPYTLAALYAE